jgi:hypothetical protein
MKSLRFVCPFAVFILAILIVGILAAQSNLSADNQPTSRPNISSRTSLEHGQPGIALHLAPFRFAKPQHNDMGGSQSAAIADVNGDGYPDLVTAHNAAPSTVAIALGNGDGTFQKATQYNSGGNFANSVAIGDVNGDGHPDLIVANMCDAGCEGIIGVLLGNGDGTFQPAITYDSGDFEAQSLAVGDVNGDGKLDLVVANYGGANHSTVSVLLGNGDGTFNSPVNYSSAGSLADSVALADVNGDGFPDLVVSNKCQINDCNFAGPVSVLLGNGHGVFQDAVPYSSGGFQYADSVAVGDVNGDGRPDIIVANWCQDNTCRTGGVSVLLGNGDGSFQSPATYDAGTPTTGCVSIADMNGDGFMDLIVNNGTPSDAVNVLLGNGDGTFGSPISFSTREGEPVAFIAVADLNHDGRPDLITGAMIVSVLLNDSMAKTTVTVVSSVDPSAINQPVTFTATVNSSISVPDGSTLDFYYEKTALGTGTILGGVAHFTTSFSKAKTYFIRAKYPGDAFHGAASSYVEQVVHR